MDVLAHRPVLREGRLMWPPARGTVNVTLDGRAWAYLVGAAQGRGSLADAYTTWLEVTPAHAFAVLPASVNLNRTNPYAFRTAPIHHALPIDPDDTTVFADGSSLVRVHNPADEQGVLLEWIRRTAARHEDAVVVLHDHVGSYDIPPGVPSVRMAGEAQPGHQYAYLPTARFDEYQEVAAELSTFFLLGAVLGGWHLADGDSPQAQLLEQWKTATLLGCFSLAYDGEGYVCLEATAEGGSAPGP